MLQVLVNCNTIEWWKNTCKAHVEELQLLLTANLILLKARPFVIMKTHVLWNLNSGEVTLWSLEARHFIKTSADCWGEKCKLEFERCICWWSRSQMIPCLTLRWDANAMSLLGYIHTLHLLAFQVFLITSALIKYLLDLHIRSQKWCRRNVLSVTMKHWSLKESAHLYNG